MMKFVYLACSLSLPLILSACSEAPPPTAEGNSIYRTKPADTGSGTCLGGVAAVAPEGGEPEAPPSNGAPPTAAGVMVRDGVSGYSVNCEMKKSGDEIEFNVSLESPQNFLSEQYPGKTNIKASGSINLEASSGVGDVTFFIPGIGTVAPVGDSQCSFLASGGGLFIEYDAGDKQTQDTGDMWITFTCPTVRETNAGANNLCQSVGTINVADCEGI